MSSNLNDAASVPTALSAFLRGVERRGALFAELQCGDRDAGDNALAAAMRAFRTHAGAEPMVDWPRRFWTLLVATPQLRQSAPMAHWPAGTEGLAALQSLPRQSLLLRMVAGLPEEEAAGVLNIDPQAHEQALAAACPRDAGGQPDALGWRTLAETIQSLLRDMPPQRLARLARLREAAIAGTRIENPASPSFLAEVVPSPSRRWPWVLLVLAVCASALAATWWWPQGRSSGEVDATLDSGVRRLQDQAEITSEEIPAQRPAKTFDPTTALLTHRDFELLLEPQDEAIARDADFLAWYAAGANAPSDGAETNPDVQAPTQATGTETTDAQF
ncbi:MAG: hypothetical protein ABWZ08_11595 [Pseudoxanthomonas sp.]